MRSIDDTFHNIFARIGVLFARYFTDFRWVEFSTALGAAWACGQQVGTVYMHLPPEKSLIIAKVAVCVGALMYIRNPKKSDWKEPGSIKNAGEENENA